MKDKFESLLSLMLFLLFTGLIAYAVAYGAPEAKYQSLCCFFYSFIALAAILYIIYYLMNYHFDLNDQSIIKVGHLKSRETLAWGEYYKSWIDKYQVQHILIQRSKHKKIIHKTTCPICGKELSIAINSRKYVSVCFLILSLFLVSAFSLIYFSRMHQYLRNEAFSLDSNLYFGILSLNNPSPLIKILEYLLYFIYASTIISLISFFAFGGKDIAEAKIKDKDDDHEVLEMNKPTI